jgi:hypothetical protein
MERRFCQRNFYKFYLKTDAELSEIYQLFEDFYADELLYR